MKNSTLKILRAKAWKNRNKKNLGVVTNPLIGDSVEVESKDDFLSRLGHIAYAKPKVEKTEDGLHFSSSWFFTLPEDYAEENKNTVGVESLPSEPENVELYRRLDSYRDSIGSPVQANMRVVSDYILNELSPALLGFQAGVEESRSIIEHTVGELDNYMFNLLELMTREALKLKLSKFIASYYGLTVKEAQAIVEKVLPPKQREVVVPVPIDNYARPSKDKDVKKDQG